MGPVVLIVSALAAGVAAGEAARKPIKHAHPTVERSMQDCAATRQLLGYPGAVILLYARWNEATRRVVTESFAHSMPDRVHTRML